MSEKPNLNLSRREFLQAALFTVGILTIPKIPEWVENLEDELFHELVEICKGVLTENQVLDVLDEDDYQIALGLVYSFILDSGIDPDAYLISQEHLLNSLDLI